MRGYQLLDGGGCGTAAAKPSSSQASDHATELGKGGGGGGGGQTIGWFGSIALLANNITGPAMVQVGTVFAQAGWLPATLLFALCGVLSGWASVLLGEVVEALQVQHRARRQLRDAADAAAAQHTRLPPPSLSKTALGTEEEPEPHERRGTVDGVDAAKRAERAAPRPDAPAGEEEEEDSRIELADAVKELASGVWPDWAFQLVFWSFIGLFTASNVSAIIESAQTTDQLLVHFFGVSCAYVPLSLLFQRLPDVNVRSLGGQPLKRRRKNPMNKQIIK